MSSRQNEFPVTHIVAGTIIGGVLSILPGVRMSVWGQICQCNGVITVHVAVTNLHRCLLEIRMKAEFEAGSRQGAICLPLYKPGPLCVALQITETQSSLTILSLQQSSLHSERTSCPVLLTETAFHLITVSISLQHHYLVIFFFVSFVISYYYHLWTAPSTERLKCWLQ